MTATFNKTFKLKATYLLAMSLAIAASFQVQAGYELRVNIDGLPANTTPCYAPWGAAVASGSEVPAYTAETVAYGESCSSVATTLSCSKGVLAGTGTHQACSVLPGCSAPGSQVYSTAGTYTFTLPAGCSVANLTAKAWGAGGGFSMTNGSDSNSYTLANGGNLGLGGVGGGGGAPGGYASANQELAAGNTITVIVGGAATTWGGGGASAVTIAGAPLVVAGGGGAGGYGTAGYGINYGYQGTPGGSASTSLIPAGGSALNSASSPYPGGSSSWGAGGTGKGNTSAWPAVYTAGGGGGGHKGGLTSSTYRTGGGGSSYAANGGTTIAGTISTAYTAPSPNAQTAVITVSVGGSNQEGYAEPAGRIGRAGRVVLTWQ